MAVLSAEHKKQLRKMLEQYARLDTVLQRRIFLEDAGLLWLESQFASNTGKQEFCYEVVMLCEKAGTPSALGEDATIHLLHVVRDDIVAGHEAKIAEINEMLAAHEHRKTVSPTTPLGSVPTGNGYIPPDTLWQELMDAEADKDWSAVITIGEQLRGMGYKVRDTRRKLENAYNLRGHIYHNRGEYDKSINDYSHAILLDSNNAAYHKYRGVTYHVAAYHNHPAGDWAKAIADYSRAIDLDPQNANYFFERGKSYHTAAYQNHSAGDFAKAITDHSCAIDLDPKNAEYYYARGVAYNLAANNKHSIGSYSKAINDLTCAIELDSTNGEYYYWRGVYREKSGDYSAAKADKDKGKMLGYNK